MSGIKTFLSSSVQFETLTCALALLAVLAALTTVSYAQSNFAIIHNLTEAEGYYPYSAPTLDAHGNLYGTLAQGGKCSACGTVYHLTHVNGSWIFNLLYSFTNQGDLGPIAGVTIGPDGTLFGAASSCYQGCSGTIFNLKPPANACVTALCPWTETILYPFAGGSDGAFPEGNVAFDFQGNLYGTTYYGGTYGLGTVYEATRSGGTWNESVIHSFGTAYDGWLPEAGVVLDSAGNLYGTTPSGGFYVLDGSVFELSPPGRGWIETLLHTFQGEGDGATPGAGLVFDRAGNLYGGTAQGTIFELTPQGTGWSFTTIHTFPNRLGPWSTLAIDSAGNLYGTVPWGGPYSCGSYGCGYVFELSPSSGGEWTYTELYDFTGGSDGAAPVGGVAVTGPSGYLYGTTQDGGTNDCGGGTDNCGVVYEINLGAH